MHNPAIWAPLETDQGLKVVGAHACTCTCVYVHIHVRIRYILVQFVALLCNKLNASDFIIQILIARKPYEFDQHSGLESQLLFKFRF